ncbi:MAG: hypothetical protein B1H13_12600 [Desulfobacteraceae bacterium 4484_190.3]|nr:MAG: hypothetical protein B1H13_12600 [Desulfobacteraceae bacterium 4484_190.3]
MDNIKVIIPNGKLFGDVIKNVSRYDPRRVDLVIGIGYSSSIQSELADSSVNLVVRPWVKTPDYWDTKFDLTRKVKEAFDENGIEIPFPQVVMHSAQADS